MSATEVLRVSTETGVRLSVEGANLVLDADTRPSDEILNALLRHKPEIIALLVTSNRD
jgi:hypothetical protein